MQECVVDRITRKTCTRTLVVGMTLAVAETKTNKQTDGSYRPLPHGILAHYI